jgi:hypothetical protein
MPAAPLAACPMSAPIPPGDAPALYADYLTEQLNLLAADYDIEIEVGRSAQQIPFPYVLDATSGVATRLRTGPALPATELALIGDEIADGIDLGRVDEFIRWPCSTGCARISRWRVWRITPAPTPTTSSALSCSPTITATSMSSWTGRHAAGEKRVYSPVGSRWIVCGSACGKRPRASVGHRMAPPPDARLPPDRARTAAASRWSTSASGPPTQRRSATTSPCCAPRHG